MRKDLREDLRTDLRQTLLSDFSQIFATKAELQELKHDVLQLKDDILGEIKAMREELAIIIGYRGAIEDHEDRIGVLERQRLTNKIKT